ncbi:MAG TPA: hypothetical protein VMS93_12655 [Candidatus Saccharimonadales bacterium]|nr:hypothetical protein [Candidatus Saccharimonadales bacterium]
MNLIQALNTYLWVWLETFRGLRRAAVVVPFLLFAVLELLALWTSAHFYQRPWGWLWIPLLDGYPGPAATHYPGYFLALPALTSRLDLVLGSLIGSIAFGWGILLFRGSFVEGRGAAGEGLRRAWARALPLIGIGVVAGAATVLLGNLLSWLGTNVLASLLGGAPLRQFAAQFLLNVLVQAALLYVPLALLLSGRGFRGAFSDGLGFFWQHRVMSLAVVVLPFLLLVPVSVAVNRPVLIATKFRPELLFTLCALNLGIAGVVNLLMTGAAVRFFLYRTRQDRPAVPQGA